MATIRKTPSATWKAVIRKLGWPTVIKTFRTKRDAADWARLRATQLGWTRAEGRVRRLK